MGSRKGTTIGRTTIAGILAAGIAASAAGGTDGFRLEVRERHLEGASGDTVRIEALLSWSGPALSRGGTILFERITSGLPPWSLVLPAPPLEPGSGLAADAPYVLPWAAGDTVRVSVPGAAEEVPVDVASDTVFIGATGPLERIDREISILEFPVDLRIAGRRAAVLGVDRSVLYDLDDPGADGLPVFPSGDLVLHRSRAVIQTAGVIESRDLDDGGREVLSDPAFPCFLPAAGDSFTLWFRSCCGDFGEWSILGADGARGAFPLGPASVGRPSVEGRRAVWREHDGGGNRVRLADLVSGWSDTLWSAPVEMNDPVLAGRFAQGVLHAHPGSRIVRAPAGPARGGVDTLYRAEGAAVRSLAPAGSLHFWLEARDRGWIVRARRSDGTIFDVEPAAAPRWSLRAERGRVLWLERIGERHHIRGFRFDPGRFPAGETPAPTEVRGRIEGVRVAADRVTIEWRLEGGGSSVDYVVLREGGSGLAEREVEIGRGRVPGSGYYAFIDRDLPGTGEERQRVRYSLRLETEAGSLRIGPVAVVLPERFDRVRVVRSGPNPSRGGVRFAVGIPAGGDPGAARFRVFDGRGRLVRSEGLGRARAGLLAVAWNGEDGGGRRVSPGVYFVRIEVGDRFRETRKVVLLDP